MLELTTHARAWTDGVLYDYLRLEIEDAKFAESDDEIAATIPFNGGSILETPTNRSSRRVADVILSKGYPPPFSDLPNACRSANFSIYAPPLQTYPRHSPSPSC